MKLMMVLVNAYNITKGGGISVALSTIELFLNEDEVFILLLPQKKEYLDFVNRHRALKANIVKTIFIPNVGIFRFILKIFIDYILSIFLIRKYQIEKVFSLGNIGLPTKTKQLVLIQNAYITLTDKKIWKHLSFWSKIYNKLGQKHSLCRLKYADVIAVQTKLMKKQLAKMGKFDPQKIIVYPNKTEYYHRNIQFPESYTNNPIFKLLLISKKYPHKNFEILQPLANEIHKSKLPITITLTLDKKNGPENNLSHKLQKNFPNIIDNAGHIDKSDLSFLYQNYDAIFLPSLLESYSAVYIEAMIFKKTILTSDLPFAKEICGDAAFYFNPFDPIDICRVIKTAADNPQLREKKILLYGKILSRIENNKDANLFKALV